MDALRRRLHELALAPDGRPRPDAPLGRGPLAARLLRQVIRGAAAAGARLDGPSAHRLAEIGGTLEWAARPWKRRVLAENLSHAVGLRPGDPRVRRLVRREIVNEARRSADLLWALARPEEVVASTRIEGFEHVKEPLAAGRGVVLAGPHVGGWEVATGVPAAVLDVPTTAVVQDDWLAWAVAGLRSEVGLRLATAGEPLAPLVRALRGGEVALVLGDTVLPGMRTHRVRFLDAWADLPAGAASLARLAGAVVVPLAVLPIAPRAWRVELDAPIEPPRREEGREGERRVTQALADSWSATLRRYPEHWAAVYRLGWHAGPEGEAS